MGAAVPGSRSQLTAGGRAIAFWQHSLLLLFPGLLSSMRGGRGAFVLRSRNAAISLDPAPLRISAGNSRSLLRRHARKRIEKVGGGRGAVGTASLFF